MKKTILSFFGTLSLIFFSLNTYSQTVDFYLDQVISTAQQVRANVNSNGAALKTLAVDYFVLGDPMPDVDAFVNLTQMKQSEIEAFEDDINNNILTASGLSSCVDPLQIQSWATTLESLSDDIILESNNLRNEILAGLSSDAFATAQLIRNYLNQQLELARDIVIETKYYEEAVVTYDIRIELVDSWGNPVTGSTGLMGYYAINDYTGEIFYPDYLNPDEFSDLCGGTYTFGAFDGYFDGASSELVTLDPSLIGPDGFLVVTLVYWSE